MCGPLAEQSAAALDDDAALVALGVDHPDAGRADGDVVDVRDAARHAAIMEQHDAGVGCPAVELGRELDLAGGAGRPGALVCRLPRERQRDAGERTEPVADSCLARRALSFVLAAGAGACR